MRQIEVKSEVNIIDFVLQEMGSTEGLFDVLILNDNLGVNSTLVKGQIINAPDEPTDVAVFEFLQANAISISTGERDILGDFNNDFNNDFDI